MIYLNGEIGAVYLNGHYHSEVYLGSTLVWSGLRKKAGTAGNEVGFTNTPQGAALVFLPGEVADIAAIMSTADAKANRFIDGLAAQVVLLASTADPIVASGIDSPVQEQTQLENAAVGESVIVNLLSQTERIKLSQPAPGGNGITVNPIVGGQDMTLVHSALEGNGVPLNPIAKSLKIYLLMIQPSGDAADAVPVQSTSGLVVNQPAPNGSEISFVNSDAENVLGASNDGDGSAGNCLGGENTNNMVARSTATPEIIVMADTLSALGMKVAGAAEGAAYIPWEYPVNNGGVLTITQVYSPEYSGGTLEVT